MSSSAVLQGLIAVAEDAKNVLLLALPKFGNESTDNEDSQDDIQGLINRLDDALEKAKQ